MSGIFPASGERRPDLTALDLELTEILLHRGLVRASAPFEWSALDRVAVDLARVQQTLEVVSSRIAAGGATFCLALERVYRWAIDVATHLADLEVAALDRELTVEEEEGFARHATATFVCTVETAIADAHRAAGDDALAWDVDTLRIAIERALFATYELG